MRHSEAVVGGELLLSHDPLEVAALLPLLRQPHSAPAHQGSRINGTDGDGPFSRISRQSISAKELRFSFQIFVSAFIIYRCALNEINQSVGRGSAAEGTSLLTTSRYLTCVDGISPYPGAYIGLGI
jgi:hypothetical protein